MQKKQLSEGYRTDDEIVRHREEVIRGMANTPPQPKVTTLHRPKKKAVSGRVARKVRAGCED